jgi:hypothetical protein
MNWFTDKFPATVGQAADRLIEDMSFKDKTWIANMDAEKLIEFHVSYGIFIRNEFRLWGNDPLLESCRQTADLKDLDVDQASYIILKEIQRKLQATNVLQVVK